MADFSRTITLEQFEKVRTLIQELWESQRSDFYRNFWKAHGFEPAMLKVASDFFKIPLLRKEALIEAQKEGIEKLLYFPELAHYVRPTSGTTSREYERVLLTFQNDTLKHVLHLNEFSSYTLFRRPLVLVSAWGMVRDVTLFSLAGGLPLIGDATDLERTAYAASKVRIDGMMVTGTQLIQPLIEILERSYEYPRTNIRTLLLGTGSWKEFAAMRTLLPHACILTHQGFSEYTIGFGYACEKIAMMDFKKEPIRFHVRRTSFLEVIDKEERIPVPPGERGEIVLTQLVRTPVPLIRYATGDEGYFFADACLCERPDPLFRVTRRLQSDFAWVGGVAFWASDFEMAVSNFKDVLEPAFHVHISEEVLEKVCVKPKIIIEFVPKRSGLDQAAFARAFSEKVALVGKGTLADAVSLGFCLPLEGRFVKKIAPGTPKFTTDVEF